MPNFRVDGLRRIGSRLLRKGGSDAVMWHGLVAELDAVLLELHRLDPRIHEYYPAGRPATEFELKVVEGCLGEALHPVYRSFLKQAAGWRHACLDMILFAPEDLIAGPNYERGREALGWLDEESVLTHYGLAASDFIVAGMAESSIDLIALQRRTAPEPGLVRWFAGYEIESYPTFGDYFHAILNLNRRRLERLREETRA
jgi:hypothetical protein